MKMLKKALVMLVIFGLAFGVRQFFLQEEKLKKDEDVFTGNRAKVFAKQVPQGNVGLIYFKENFPQRSVILACEEDLNNDSAKDLLVIFSEGGHNRLAALLKSDDGYDITTEIPAPVENQTIQFLNMDKVDEMEFIVTGEKAGQVGYAMYRIIDGEIKDLFGDGMNDCC